MISPIRASRFTQQPFYSLQIFHIGFDSQKGFIAEIVLHLAGVLGCSGRIHTEPDEQLRQDGVPLIGFSGSFQTDFQIHTPVAPQDTILYENIFVILKGIAVDALDGDGIVKGMDKGIANCDAFAVDNIHTVGIIPPLAKDTDAVQHHIKAVEQIHAPNGGIGETNALHGYVFAVIELNIAVDVIRVTM